jgi:hypothetical protein
MIVFLFASLLSLALLVFGCACSVYIHLHNGFRHERMDVEDYPSYSLSRVEYE